MRTPIPTLVVGLGFGLVVAACGSTSPTSVGSPTTAPTSTETPQQVADAAAVAGGCRPSPTATLDKPSWSNPPAMSIDTTKAYTATIRTDTGIFVITLDAKTTPITVNNFLFLAQNH